MRSKPSPEKVMAEHLRRSGFVGRAIVDLERKVLERDRAIAELTRRVTQIESFYVTLMAERERERHQPAFVTERR